jgi:site-specific DNA recombinase
VDRHRPELDALLDRLLPGDVVLAYALDRLSRSQLDTAIIIDRIEAAGASLALVTEDFEQSATGAFLRNAKAFVAELEREKIAERTQRGKRARVASGKPLTPPRAPYGYAWNADKSGYLLDPETGPAVRLIFDGALAGDSLRTISATLFAHGYPAPNGRPRWQPVSIREVLRRPVYAGSTVAYATRCERRPGGGYRRRVTSPEERVIIPNVAPPIVTVEEQVAVLSRLATNQAHSTRNNRRPEDTLLRAGFIRCGHCGRSLAVSHPPASRPGVAPVYRCDVRPRDNHDCLRPSIAASLVDAPVWEQVTAVLRDPAIIAAEVARHRSEGGLERDLAAIETRWQTIAGKQSRLAKAVATLDDEEAVAPLLAELQAPAACKTATERERDELRHRLDDQAAEDARVRTLADWCQTVGANLVTLSYAEKRMALAALGVQVHIYRPHTTDASGNPYPRWALTLAPASTDAGIAYSHTSAPVPTSAVPRPPAGGCRSSSPTRKRGFPGFPSRPSGSGANDASSHPGSCDRQGGG